MFRMSSNEEPKALLKGFEMADERRDLAFELFQPVGC